MNKLKLFFDSLKNPEFLFLLIIPVFISLWYLFKNKKISNNISFSNIDSNNHTKSIKESLRHLPFILKIISSMLMIFALARPQTTTKWEESTTEGIDIILAIDISSSMNEKDLKPNRLESAKEVAKEFVKKRKNDRIGIVLFAGESYTQCPLISDYNILNTFLGDIKFGTKMGINDGTAIGKGLTVAINRIRNTKSKSKVIILLTDGVNSTGISPIDAASIAKDYNIKIYTIGVGSKIYNPFGDKLIDEDLLKEIAELNNGTYNRATDNNSLQQIYNEIDKLEKTETQIKRYNITSENFHLLAYIAFCLILLSFILKFTYLKQII